MKYLILLLLLLSTTGYANSKKVIETIVYEASGEKLGGQLAVARVIRNRARERGLTFTEVVEQPYQFSCWNTDKHRSYNDKEFKRAINAWIKSKDYKLDANLYHSTKVKPYWINKVNRIKQIGNHIFYKED